MCVCVCVGGVGCGGGYGLLWCVLVWCGFKHVPNTCLMHALLAGGPHLPCPPTHLPLPSTACLVPLM